SGSSSTGRNTPKTPGTKSNVEDTALTGISRCTGEPARTAARIHRQRIHHEQLMPRNPHAQLPHRRAGIGLAAGSPFGNGGGPAAQKGWLIPPKPPKTLDRVLWGAPRQWI